MSPRTVRLVFCDGAFCGTVKLEDESVILSGMLYRMYLPERIPYFKEEELRKTGEITLKCKVVEYYPVQLPIETPYKTYAMVQRP